MFNSSTLRVSVEGGDAAKLRIKGILLECPSIVVLDEGHCARNSLSQVKKQLSVIRTPLRVMLSGSTLFLAVPWLSKEIIPGKGGCPYERLEFS